MITLQQENQLIDRILGGEERCYADLVEHYKSYAYTIAMKIVENRGEAEEVAQDAFVKAFLYLKNFNHQARFSTWLYRIVFNTAISHKRKKRNQFESLENRIFEDPECADAATEHDDKQHFINRALKNLSEKDQLALRLFYIKEFSLEEVAELVGQNMNTVKVRIHRARQKLADELKGILKQEALTL